MPRTATTAINAAGHRLGGRRIARGGARFRHGAIWLVCVAVVAFPASRARAGGAPGTIFNRVAAAFESSDASSLAALTHSDGLLVTGSGERASRYSPSQAVYYFRNLFEGHRTLLFTFMKSQDEASGDHARGMAAWKRRRVDSERVLDLQLVIVLTRDGDQWRLSELNMIR